MADLPSQAPAREPESPSATRGKIPFLFTLIALYAAAIYLPFLGASRTLTRHEVFVTQPALQMLNDGHWIVPRYTSVYWLDKPPLLNWITAGFFAAAGGFTEWAARLPSALSAVGLCVLVAALTRRFYGAPAALFAGLIQATCVYGYMQGRLGEIDMPFALLLTAAHAALAWQWGQGRTTLGLPAAAAFHTLVGLAVLAKGPVALALMCFTVLGYCVLRRAWWPLRAVLWTPAVGCFLLVVVPWHVAAVWEAGNEAWYQWGYNYFYRFAGAHRLGAQSLLLYFWTIPWLVLPWTVVLVLGARQLAREARRPAAHFERYLWAWFFGGFVFLLLSAFKHKHYSIPILPPLSILCGKLLAEHAARLGPRAKPLYFGIFAAALLAFNAVSVFVMPARDPRHPTVEFLRSAVAQVPPDADLYVVGLGQSAAYPYIDHRCAYLDGNTLPEVLANVRAALQKAAGRPLWALTLQSHLPAAEKEGLEFTLVAAEPERAKPNAKPKATDEEALVLGQITARKATTASAPASALESP